MSNFIQMKNTFVEKICNVGKTAFAADIGRKVDELSRYARYKLKDQWEFIYFELPIDEEMFTFTMREPLVIRPVRRNDIKRIEADIFPFISLAEQHDVRKHMSIIGSKGFNCFIAEKDNIMVHYFLVYDKALASPLIHTPFDQTKIGDGDAYLGSAFTSPHARGMWIMPYSLSKICEYLKSETDATRALLLVNKYTPGAVGFYKRLGFREIENACSSGPVAAVKGNMLKMWNKK